MFENIIKFFKGLKKSNKESGKSKEAAKERLHLVLMQDRANVSADFLDLMKQEIIEVIKKYINVDENEIDVRLANKTNEDGTTGAPALYANIPIISIKEEAKEVSKDNQDNKKGEVVQEEKTEIKEDNKKEANKEKQDDIKELKKEQRENEEEAKKEANKEETTK